MKFLISLFSSFLLSQTLYQGSLEFSYNGSETGSFSSNLEDTTNFAGALNVTFNDSSSFMMMSIAPRDENAFDLFLTILQDSTFPMQPRIWSWDISISDLANIIEDPLNLSTLSVFIPDLDSSFANQWLTFFTDSSLVTDSLSLDSLSSFFVENLLDDSYIATQGYIEIDSIGNQAVVGNFNLTMWKPLFSFTNINNGNFNFIPVNTENLPNPVTLIGPADETVLTIDEDSADGQTGIFWTSSTDPDDTPVEYILELIIENTGDTLDTVLTSSYIFLEYQEFLDYMLDSEVTHLDIVWDVYTFDEFEGVESSNGPWSLTIDGGWALDVDNSSIPEVFVLHNSYPNPFNPTTKIPFSIKESQNIKISIFNINGKLIQNISNQYFESGNHYVKFSSKKLSSGIYFIMLNHKNGIETQKITFLK
ncbi:MAG: T9SS type A sorting domain-containing protein [Candidatus Neomarinimicrobiota bacterium]